MTDVLAHVATPSSHETPPEDLPTRVDHLAAQVSQYGPRSVPSDLRREHLLACASLLFTERGFDDTTMNAVASLAGVSKPVVYDVFGSKEELFGATMLATHEELLTRVVRAVETEPDPNRHSFVASRAYFRFVREREAAWQTLLRSGPGLVGEWVDEMQRRHAEFLAELIARNLATAGVAFDTRKVEALAVTLVGAVDSMARWWVHERDISVDEIARFYASAMDPAVRAVLTPFSR